MSKFFVNGIFNFFIALGVILGGCLFGSVAATLTGQPPLKVMAELAQRLKIWALVVALGGTFSSFRVIELGLVQGEVRAVVRQLAYIFIAFCGAHLGYIIISLLEGGGK